MFWQQYMLYMWEEELYCSYYHQTFKYYIHVLQQGVIGELRVMGDPFAASRHCEEDEDDSDIVSNNLSHTYWMTHYMWLNSLDIWHKLVRKVFTEVKLQCCFHIEFYISRLVTSQKNASLNIV